MHFSTFSRSALCAIPFLSACGSPQFSDIESEIPGSVIATPSLGSAFNSHTAKTMNIICLEGEVTDVGNTESEVQYKQDMSYSEIVDRLNGQLSVDVQFPLVSASAGIGYASENASTNVSETHTIFLNTVPKSRMFKPGTFRLTPDGEYFVKERSAELTEKCGDEFVSQIDYGAGIMATLKFEFANTKDKEEFKGKLKVDVNVGAGKVQVEGNLEKVSQEILARTTMSVQASQAGGTPEELFRILPENMVLCSLSDMSPCLQVFRNLLAYSKDNFREQLKKGDAYNVVRYITQPYGSSGVVAGQLVPPIVREAVSVLVKERRAEWQDNFDREILNYRRSKHILAQVSGALTVGQKKKVEEIMQASYKNSEEYGKGVIFCFDNPNSACTDKVLKITKYNEDDLEVGLSQWRSAILAGRAVRVVLDRTRSKFDDSVYSGSWQTDPMGSLKGGETYSVQIVKRESCSFPNIPSYLRAGCEDSRFTASPSGFMVEGLNQGTNARGTWVYFNGNPVNSEISLWGRVVTYDTDGVVFDPKYGEVGHLEMVN